jgi:hypothetical protein
MRCSACNVILTTQESTRKFKVSGDYVDMCNKCLHTIDEDVQYSEGNNDNDTFEDEE